LLKQNLEGRNKSLPIKYKLDWWKQRCCNRSGIDERSLC